MVNMVVLSYIKRMVGVGFSNIKGRGGGGGTHNKVLSGLAKEIWDYLIVNRITITTKYLTGILK